jgi:hypothetical protein
MEGLPLVSFVIPVRDDAARLRRCLASIARNEYPPGLLEVVVADNGSRDGSARVAREAGARLLELPGLKVAELRNRAAAAAGGQVLAFVDADHEIDPDWALQAIDALRRPGVGAVGAPYLPPSAGTWVQHTYDTMRSHPPGVHEVEWLASGNLAVRRAGFDRLGGFDARLATCEDYDLCRRLRAAGWQVVSDERLRSVHLGDPATLRALFLGELWRGRGSLRAGLRALSPRSAVGLAVPVVELASLALAAAGLAAAPDGLTLAAGAPAAIGALAGLRALRMLGHRPGAAGAGMALQAFAVACVYDVARALALVCPAGHAVRRAGEGR